MKSYRVPIVIDRDVDVELGDLTYSILYGLESIGHKLRFYAKRVWVEKEPGDGGYFWSVKLLDSAPGLKMDIGVGIIQDDGQYPKITNKVLLDLLNSLIERLEAYEDL